jgi:Stage II sporulation protein E (SpoIIE)
VSTADTAASTRHRTTSARHHRSSLAGRANTPAGAVLTAAATAPQATSSVATARRTRTRARAKQAQSNPLEEIGKQLPLPIPVPNWSKPVILVLLLLALFFGVRSRLAAVRAKRLEAQRTALLEDVNVMQMALVPEVPAKLGELAVSVAYRPAEGPAAGGDFFDLFIPAPGKVAIILGDVCGHGPEALNHAALTRYTLRAYLQAGLEPRAALMLAGRALADPTGEHYATVMLGVYDERSATLTYASAGHPPPILLGLHDSRAHVSACSSPPIGWGVPTGRRQTVVSLPAGSRVCFLSDGLIEARRGGELLGHEGVQDLLGKLGPVPSATDLLERVRAVSDATTDDMAACIVAPIAPPVSSGVEVRVEELEVDGAALRAGQLERFLVACEIPEHEISRLTARARGLAAEVGTAVLRIELSRDGTKASIGGHGPGARRAVVRRPSRGAAQPLLEVLQAS